MRWGKHFKSVVPVSPPPSSHLNSILGAKRRGKKAQEHNDKLNESIGGCCGGKAVVFLVKKRDSRRLAHEILMRFALIRYAN